MSYKIVYENFNYESFENPAPQQRLCPLFSLYKDKIKTLKINSLLNKKK
jgi:hypothetical protein